MQPPQAIRKILVPTDFSTCADHALRYALELARPLGATIELCHASVPVDYQVLNLVSPAMQVAAASLVQQMEQMFEAARHELDELVARYRDAGVPLSGTTLEGEPDEAIVRRAREGGADLIVIGSHGRRGLSRALLGSVAERVMRHAPCPVLVVHPPAK
jgi:nucleotide-binding universal stress UspA family protein